jgi:hypothetical protein
MGLQFKRSVLLEIMTGPYTPVFGISDLRIDFSVNLTVEPEPNSADFTIFNLSEMTRTMIVNMGKFVRFSAGYTGNANGIACDEKAVIFYGYIITSKSRKEATGYVTN